METKIHLIEHLIRLSVILRISHYSGNNKEGKEFIKSLEELTEELKNIYQTERDHLTVFTIGQCISLKDKKSDLHLLESSKNYIKENASDLDTYIVSKILSEISKYIYKLKFL